MSLTPKALNRALLALATRDRRALAAEGERLVAFATGAAGAVRFAA